VKNGRALFGHKRQLTAVGTRDRCGVPSGGWLVACKCGWNGRLHVKNDDARAEYRAHIDELLAQPFVCKTCGTAKLLPEMSTDYRYVCRACLSAKGNQWSKDHPQESRYHKRKNWLRKRYGIAPEHEEQLLKNQNWKCAICQRSFENIGVKGTHVDHDHLNGLVRGLLCFNCNAGLGSFKDDPTRLRRAILYLEKHRSSLPFRADDTTTELHHD
jgi:hypothetical protein